LQSGSDRRPGEAIQVGSRMAKGAADNGPPHCRWEFTALPAVHAALPRQRLPTISRRRAGSRQIAGARPNAGLQSGGEPHDGRAAAPSERARTSFRGSAANRCHRTSGPAHRPTTRSRT